MKLTGEAKNKFEEWFLENMYQDYSSHDKLMFDFIEAFYTQPNAMKWGVYVDFFYSEIISISIGRFRDLVEAKKQFTTDVSIVKEIHGKDNWVIVHEQDFNTIIEARNKAIVKANELLNNK